MQCPCGMQMGSWDIKAGQVDSCSGCGRYEVRPQKTEPLETKDKPDDFQDDLPW